MSRKLTDIEIDFIQENLQKQGVEDTLVLAELTDHLSILTEAELYSEPDFYMAFTIALKKFNRKDLLNISRNKESFYAHPKFLNKTFFIVFGLVSIVIFIVGIYLRINLLPGRRVLQVIGAASFGYIYLPLLLLSWLTEYANKTKCITGFMGLFAAFHAFAGWYLNWPIAWLFMIVTALFAILFLAIFILIPHFKTNNHEK
ncbi:MAG: hypothetical protein FD123_1548 [Bacteroidetes bacterium]|nr:MAG: hypothetical protein FD123_1548 [Bacteroidota bacterium]